MIPRADRDVRNTTANRNVPARLQIEDRNAAGVIDDERRAVAGRPGVHDSTLDVSANGHAGGIEEEEVAVHPAGYARLPADRRRAPDDLRRRPAASRRLSALRGDRHPAGVP